jgi:hypothetical protein
MRYASLSPHMDNTPSGNFCLDDIGRLTDFLIASGSSGHAPRCRNKNPRKNLSCRFDVRAIRGRSRISGSRSEKAREKAGSYLFATTVNNGLLFFVVILLSPEKAPPRCSGIAHGKRRLRDRHHPPVHQATHRRDAHAVPHTPRAPRRRSASLA